MKIILAADTHHRLQQIFLLSLREFSERIQMSNDSKVGFHKGLLLRKNTEEERATVSSTRLLMTQPDGTRKVTHGLA